MSHSATSPSALHDVPALGAMTARDRARRTGGRILPLMGAPVLPMPEHVREAVRQAMDQPDPRDSRGLPELRAAIAAELSPGVDPERRLLVTNGAMHGLSLALRTLLAPGDEVIVPTPAYFFDGAIRESGATPKYVPSHSGWTFDLDGMAAAVTSRSRAVLLCNPVNPTGYLPDAETVAAVVGLAARHGLFVVSDDSWQHFVFDGRRHHPVEALAETWPHLITVTSLSKYYALATWRLGYVLAPPAVVDAMERRLQWEAVCCGAIPQHAAAAALTGPREWLDRALSTYQRKRDLVCAGVEASGLPAPVRPGGGAFLLADCARLGDTPDAIDRALLRNGIATIRGTDLHAPESHVRITFGAAEPVLEELVGALSQACRES
ncbi:pyridoxal phosphate-dependent aminotransferase [Amycolatopsis benzoatilytica]|uniref:pyridoxal phosphate-dependent aminotransferase n=1 Tax=Amycolatopsis benzoatilytica TaxID=346045 RepID=UPI0012B69EB7|nr:pyridoxal phosphate-dependent aminotransferase [Amycolatopsis benzoatilytica]